MSELNNTGVQNTGEENTGSENPADNTNQGGNPSDQSNTQDPTTNPSNQGGDGGQDPDPNQDPGDGGEDEKKPVPYSRFSEVNTEKNNLKTTVGERDKTIAELREKLKGYETQKPSEESSSKTQDPAFSVKNLDEKQLDQLFEGLDLAPVPEDERDSEGKMVRPAFRNYTELVNWIRKDIFKTMTILSEKDKANKTAREKVADDKADAEVAKIQQTFGEDKDGFKQFAVWSKKEYENGSQSTLAELHRFFTNHIYKKDNNTQKKDDTADKINNPNGNVNTKDKGLPMSTIMNTSFTDL